MSDGDMDWEEGVYILRKSWCPAVLTENFFMDPILTTFVRLNVKFRRCSSSVAGGIPIYCGISQECRMR